MRIHFSEEFQVARGELVLISPKTANGHTWDADSEQSRTQCQTHYLSL